MKRADVLMGRDGWLYLDGNPEHMVEHFQGLLQFSPPDLLELQNLLEHRRDWLAQHGTEYLFVVAPDNKRQTVAGAKGLCGWPPKARRGLAWPSTAKQIANLFRRHAFDFKRIEDDPNIRISRRECQGVKLRPTGFARLDGPYEIYNFGAR